jgi:uncharacterized protein YbcI
MEDLTMPRGDGAVPPEQQSVLLLMSNEMVRLYKDLFGRGPTRSRSGWADPDTLLCTLEESMTPAERNMTALGEHGRLRDVRMFFQHASAHEFIAAAESATGRKVRSFVSGIDTEHDVSSEVFYFDPETR